MDEMILNWLSSFTKTAAAAGVTDIEQQVRLLKFVAARQLNKEAQSYPPYMTAASTGTEFGPTMGRGDINPHSTGRLADLYQQLQKERNYTPVGRFFHRLGRRFTGGTDTDAMKDMLASIQADPRTWMNILRRPAEDAARTIGAARQFAQI